MFDPVLSHFQVRPLLGMRGAELGVVSVSLDLGLSERELVLDEGGLHLGEGQLVSWEDLAVIAAAENSCFAVDSAGSVRKLAFYSDFTERAYSLFPTTSAPTMLVSGITMHRIVDSDPWADTTQKIRALGTPPAGRVLDTCMGLGYTAIQAAAAAAAVLTCELDPVVETVCRANPWSRPLFERPNIERRIGHVWDIVEGLPNGSFSAILHDPPMFNMAGELYSGEFYAELHRLLAHKGRLFHYIGNPDSRSGASVTRGVVKRLHEAGFRRVTLQPRAFGVLAVR